MNTSAPSPQPSSLAARIAWMHEPVRLSSSRLPWVLRWILAAAIHRMLCTLEQGIFTLLELQRQGKLEPWPEQAEAAPAPRVSRYHQKCPLITQACAAGRTAVPVAAAAEPKQGAASEALPVEAGPTGEDQTAVAIRSAACIITLPQPMPRSACGSHARPCLPQQSPARGAATRPRDRCQKSMVFEPAWAGWDNCA